MEVLEGTGVSSKTKLDDLYKQNVKTRENISGLGKDNMEGISEENPCDSLAMVVSCSVADAEYKLLIDINPDIRSEWGCEYR